MHAVFIMTEARVTPNTVHRTFCPGMNNFNHKVSILVYDGVFLNKNLI